MKIEARTLELGGIRLRPPVGKIALGIELASLVVEAVRHFMSDG